MAKESLATKRMTAMKSLSRAVSPDVFREADLADPTKTRVLSKGDSWFAYPRRDIFIGAPNNVVDCLSKQHPELLFKDMSQNGAEAVAMICGDEKLSLLQTVATTEFDILMFSGGGNDIVGVYDFYFMLNTMTAGMTWQQCINEPHFRRRCERIRDAYIELIELVSQYSKNPKIHIITHTYDWAIPRPDGAVFFDGLLKIEGGHSWMHPSLIARNITFATDQRAIAKYLLSEFGAMLKEIAKSYPDRFTVVDTQGTLTSELQWLNEIHPNAEGFAKVTDVIWENGVSKHLR